MQVPWQSIQGFSGAVAVGGLTLTSLLLLIGVFASSIFPAIDFLSKSTAWAIIVAVPVASLTYVVGLLTNAAAELLYVRVGWLPRGSLTDELVRINGSGDFLIGRFLYFRQEAEILAGGSLALSLFATTCAVAAYPAEGWRRTLITMTLLSAVLCIGSAVLSISRFRSASSLSTARPLPEDPK
jgi:hypothetical protein